MKTSAKLLAFGVCTCTGPTGREEGGGAAETLPQGSSGHGRPSIVRNISISTRTLFSLTIVIIMIINVVVVAGCGSDSVT